MLQPLSSFQFVPSGTVVAKDAQGNVYYNGEEGAFVILPKTDIVIGEEVWWWAEEVKPTAATNESVVEVRSM